MNKERSNVEANKNIERDKNAGKIQIIHIDGKFREPKNSNQLLNLYPIKIR